MLSVFALLTVLLTVINGINFTMASNDADNITQMISERNGTLSEQGVSKKKKPQNSATPDMPERDAPGNEKYGSKRMGPMGPDAPDMNSSLRYFTVSFDVRNNTRILAFNMSAVDEDEAVEWARELRYENETGWTRGTYRYRIYKAGSRTNVVVVDQGRELLPSYRILIFSICGEIIGLVLSYIVLRIVGNRLFAPLEEADRKQKQFIANIESEFKVPLTVINADTELIEKENGSSECTKSINRQVKKMTALVKDIGSLAIFDESDMTITDVNLSSTLSRVLDSNKDKFKEKNINLEISIDDYVVMKGKDEALRRVCTELVENSLRYSKTKASFNLKREDERIFLTQTNDTSLPAGSIDQIFDRFTVLDNAADDAIGLGLSHVKDIVKQHNGRVSAKVSEGEFGLKIAF